MDYIIWTVFEVWLKINFLKVAREITLRLIDCDILRDCLMVRFAQALLM